MAVVKYNSNVLLHYSLKGNGQVFESTYGGSPIKLKIGQSSLPQIIESALYGLQAGDKKEYSFSSKNIFVVDLLRFFDFFDEEIPVIFSKKDEESFP